ncbi:MAG: hypothetical protein M5U26_01565 [Planctomycetota bacterium]|nr:hypothetical protein [Planctomycetota bacterium]
MHRTVQGDVAEIRGQAAFQGRAAARGRQAQGQGHAQGVQDHAAAAGFDETVVAGQLLMPQPSGILNLEAGGHQAGEGGSGFGLPPMIRGQIFSQRGQGQQRPAVAAAPVIIADPPRTVEAARLMQKAVGRVAQQRVHPQRLPAGFLHQIHALAGQTGVQREGRYGPGRVDPDLFGLRFPGQARQPVAVARRA